MATAATPRNTRPKRERSSSAVDDGATKATVELLVNVGDRVQMRGLRAPHNAHNDEFGTVEKTKYCKAESGAASSYCQRVDVRLDSGKILRRIAEVLAKPAVKEKPVAVPFY